MAWAKNGTPTTLGSAADDMDITNLTAKKFNVFLTHALATGGTIREIYTFNNDSNVVYAVRYNRNGGTDATSVSIGAISHASAVAEDLFELFYICSISGEEKLGIGFYIRAGTAGATTAPQRTEWVYKFVPSPDADITRVDSNNSAGTGDFATSSNLSALGTD